MTQLSPDAITDAWLARSRDTVHGRLAPEAETVGIVEHVADGIAQVSGSRDCLSELLSSKEEGSALRSRSTPKRQRVLLDEGDAIEAGRGSLDTRGRAGAGRPGFARPRLRPSARSQRAGRAEDTFRSSGPPLALSSAIRLPARGHRNSHTMLFAIGRSTRAVIGDRATGKTAIAIDAIINQKNLMSCVYVAVGQRTTAVKRAEAVRRYGAPERCIFVVAGRVLIRAAMIAHCRLLRWPNIFATTASMP